MRIHGLLLLAIPIAAFGQRLADPAKLGPALDLLTRDPFQATLRCRMTPVRPWLNFGLRLQAGYLIEGPMDQFSGAVHQLRSVTEITPSAAGAKPVYLANWYHLESLPAIGALAQMPGAYLLGAGAYTVRMVVFDETGRACRSEWPVTAVWNDLKLRPPIPPNTIAEFHWAASSGASGAAEPVFDRLTVLFDAAPLDARSSQLTAEDTAMLLGALDALLDQIPARSARLVAFNLDQQKELLARDGFTAAGLDELEAALHNQQLAAVDYRVLQNRAGPMETLTNLVNRELRAEKPADALVFLGPTLHTSWHLPKDAVSSPPAPTCFYFQFHPALTRRPGAEGEPGPSRTQGFGGPGASRSHMPASTPNGGPVYGADPIASLVAQLKGHVFSVGTPREFARAVQHVRQPGDRR
jgi:hypothetical protein